MGTAVELCPFTGDLATFGWGYDGAVASSAVGMAMTVLALSLMELRYHETADDEASPPEDGEETKSPEKVAKRLSSNNLIFQLASIRAKCPGTCPRWGAGCCAWTATEPE